MYYFKYDGIDSRDMGLVVRKANTLSSPTRSIETTEIMGRNGSLHIDNGHFGDRVISFECQIIADSKEDMAKKATQIFNWLQLNIGYKRLILSEDPKYYYEAIFANNIEITRSIIKVGEVKIIFECKPMKKLISGEEIITITKPTDIYNSTPHKSNPYIKIYGSGDVTLKIGNQSVLIKDIKDYIELDSELMDCFKGSESCNNQLYSMPPQLNGGRNNISWVGNITKLEIKPRWNNL